MIRGIRRLAVAAVAAGLLATFAALPVGAAPAGAGVNALFVGCGYGYQTIGAAVFAASSGQTIFVCPGTYHENVVVPSSKQLSIRGIGVPIIEIGRASCRERV